jgi:hypothetical protein
VSVVRLVLLALVVALTGPLLAGCGSAGNGGDQDVKALLSETFGKDKPIRSGKLALQLNVDAQGLASLQRPLALRVAGPFQGQGSGQVPKFDFDVDVDSGGTAVQAGAVSTGDKGFLTLEGRSYQLSDALFKRLERSGKQATASKGTDQGTSLKALGIDPRRWLKDAREQGVETLSGVQVIHVSAGIDVPRFVADLTTLLAKAGKLGVTGGSPQLPSTLTQAQRDKIVKSVKRADVDVWTGKDDKALRRIAMHVSFDVPDDVRPKGTPAQRGTLRFDLAIAELNRTQAIGAPANPRPLSELTTALGQVLGGAQGSTQQQGGSSPDYQQCLDAAGTDIAKAQQCAGLLGR